MEFFSKLILLFCLISYSFSKNVYQYKSYKDYKIYEIKGDSSKVAKLIKFFNDKYEIPYAEVSDTFGSSIMIPPEIETEFKDLAKAYKLEYKVVVEDCSKLIENEKISPRGSHEFSWTAYYDVDDIYGYLRNASASKSDWTEVIVGGESSEGRQILGIRINKLNDTYDKPVMFIESGIHAREWITPATTTYFINQLLTSEDAEIASLRDRFDWRIFPIVNPDGYHYSFNWDRMWRKTRSKSSNGCYGADANRNWNYNWLEHGSSTNPCDYQTYAGSKPFSEKETRTLSEYVSKIGNLLGYIAFHSYAQTLLLPYSDSTEHVDNYDDLVQIGKTSLEYGKAVNGEEYEGPDTAANILYKASGGSMDWVRYALGTRLVYTYELRGYFFHWPSSRISEQGDEVTQMMVGLVKEAGNLGYY